MHAASSFIHRTGVVCYLSMLNRDQPVATSGLHVLPAVYRVVLLCPFYLGYAAN